jgi:hypothetical protein
LIALESISSLVAKTRAETKKTVTLISTSLTKMATKRAATLISTSLTKAETKMKAQRWSLVVG